MLAAVGDLGDGVGVLLGVAGHTGFDFRDAHLVQQLGDSDLVLLGEYHTCLLFTVAQGAVAQCEVFVEVNIFCHFREGVEWTQIV